MNECREGEGAIIECMDEEGTIYKCPRCGDEEGTIYKCPRCGDETDQWGKKILKEFEEKQNDI